MLYRVFRDGESDQPFDEVTDKWPYVRVGELLPIVEDGVEAQREVTKVSGQYRHGERLAMSVWVK